jgi:cell division protein FtsB
VFASCGLLLNLLVGSRGLPALLQARRQYAALAADVMRVHSENARLRREIARLRTDPDTIEELARRELGFIRPGERVVIIRDAAPAGSPAPRP